ncbi:MAG: hypothetical protein IPJ46_23180 [Anaerolineales bacterium]|nr:hypothetical protein [Anaerolineales bacterium]
MLGSRISRKIVLFVASLSLLACALPAFGASTQVPQPVGPESLGTPIAQTAAAAGTQTAIFSPPTLTQTLTPFPTGTLISAPTLPTFIYALPTLTPLPTFTTTPAVILQIPGGEGGGNGAPGGSIYTGREWTCAIRGRTPPMGFAVEQGKSFYVTITLFNNGTRAWLSDSVDFRYKSGLRNDGKPIQDLPKTVSTGSEITVQFLLTAPGKPDTYSTVWTLRVGRTSFCGVKYSFVVK